MRDRESGGRLVRLMKRRFRITLLKLALVRRARKRYSCGREHRQTLPHRDLNILPRPEQWGSALKKVPYSKLSTSHREATVVRNRSQVSLLSAAPPPYEIPSSYQSWERTQVPLPLPQTQAPTPPIQHSIGHRKTVQERGSLGLP